MFFAFEGPEASGKSTLVHAVARAIGDRAKVCVVREPGGTWLGDAVRQQCLKSTWTKLDGLSQAALIYAARREHWLRVIQPHLKQGGVVLTDRWHISTYVYQSGMANVPFETLRDIEKRLIPSEAIPCKSFLLLASPEELEARLNANFPAENGERAQRSLYNHSKIELKRSIHTFYRHYAHALENVTVLDASLPLASLAKLVSEEIVQTPLSIRKS